MEWAGARFCQEPPGAGRVKVREAFLRANIEIYRDAPALTMGIGREQTFREGERDVLNDVPQLSGVKDNDFQGFSVGPLGNRVINRNGGSAGSRR